MPKLLYTTSIQKCARCKLDHDGIEVYELSNPPEDVENLKRFAYCPTTKEPILIYVVEVEKVKGG